MSEVLSFKLISGEEVIAEVVQTNRASSLLLEGPDTSPIVSYVVRRPHILQFQPMGNGQLGLAFVPWTLSNPGIERVILPKEAVLLTFEPSSHAERQYIEQTSGIALAPPGSRIST